MDNAEILKKMQKMLRTEPTSESDRYSMRRIGWNEALHSLAYKITGISPLDPSPLGKSPVEK